MARFRLDAARAADRAPFDELATALAEVSPEFARFWRDHDVVEFTEGLKEIVHPALGVIEFDLVTLAHLEPDGSELRISLYAPRPGTSTERARRLFDGVPR